MLGRFADETVLLVGLHYSWQTSHTFHHLTVVVGVDRGTDYAILAHLTTPAFHDGGCSMFLALDSKIASTRFVEQIVGEIFSIALQQRRQTPTLPFQQARAIS